VSSREPPDAETILLEVGKPLEFILGDFGYPTDPVSTSRFVATYRRHFAEHMSDHTRLYPQVRETLALLRESRVRLAVVTTKHQVQAELSLRASRLADSFDYVQGWSDGRKHKPDPEPVESTLAALGVEAASALMVGDSEQDILAARAARVASCAVTYGFRPVLLLRSFRPDFMISRIDDLPAIVIDS
jgi:phosphoglycolate phosphatase